MVVAAVVLFFVPVQDNTDAEFHEGKTRLWLRTHFANDEDSNSAQPAPSSWCSPNNPEFLGSDSTVSKADVRKSLAFLSSYYTQACPCRGNLKQVYNFLREQLVDPNIEPSVS